MIPVNNQYQGVLSSLRLRSERSSWLFNLASRIFSWFKHSRFTWDYIALRFIFRSQLQSTQKAKSFSPHPNKSNFASGEFSGNSRFV